MEGWKGDSGEESGEDSDGKSSQSNVYRRRTNDLSVQLHLRTLVQCVAVSRVHN
jgi:hypothetical protein